MTGSLPDDFVGGWEAHEDEQRRISLEATPTQRLAWLEDAIRFAFVAGALPARDHDARPEQPGA